MNPDDLKLKLGVLIICTGKPDIPDGKSNYSRHSVWEASEIWAVIWGDSIFLLFFVCSADLEKLCTGSFSHHVKFYSFMYMHKISIQVVV